MFTVWFLIRLSEHAHFRVDLFPRVLRLPKTSKTLDFAHFEFCPDPSKPPNSHY